MSSRPPIKITRAFGLVAFLLAITCIGASAVPTGSTGEAWQIPQSGIDLTRVYSELRIDYDVVNRRPGPLYFIDCADFVNRAHRTAINVQVMFSRTATNGTTEPPMLLDVRGVLGAGAKNRNFSCLDPAYKSRDHGYRLVGWVSAVSYQDGSMWHAAPAVQGTVDGGSASGVVLTDPVTYFPLEECDDITNASSKVVTHTQIMFEHRGIDGAELGDDALDVRRNIAPGETLKNACRGFNGYSVPDVFYYARALSHGESSVPQPRIFFDGKESRLLVMVSVVDFADGTSWHYEAPPPSDV